VLDAQQFAFWKGFMMNTKAPIWSVLVFSLMLSACMDKGSSFTVNILQPVQAQVTNSTLDVRLEIAGSTPDAFNSLTVTLEYRKNASPDVDASYTGFKTFSKGDAYPFKYTWDTTLVPEGEYALRAKAIYTAGGFDGQPRTAISAPRTVTIDRTRPSVVSSTPASDAGNVLVTDPITVMFNKAVSASSLTEENVKLFQEGTALGRTVKLSSDGKTLTVTLSTQLSTPKMLNSLKLELSEGVTDETGNKLIPKAWSWTIPAWLRLGEVRSSAPGLVNALYRSFRVGKDNKPVVLWRGFKPGEVPNTYDFTQTSGVYVSRWNGSSWVSLGGDLKSSEDNTTFVNVNEVQLDSNNNPVVAWTRILRSVSSVTDQARVSHWNGSSWQTTGGLESAITKNSSIGPFVLDEKDNPIVSWNGSADTMFVSKLSETAWQQYGNDFKSSFNGTAYIYSPITMSFNLDNEPIVFWVEGRNTTLPIEIVDYALFAHRWTGKVWKIVPGFEDGLRNSFGIVSGTRFRLTSAGQLNGHYVLSLRKDNELFVVRQSGPTVWEPLGEGLGVLTGITSLCDVSSLVLDSKETLTTLVSGLTQQNASTSKYASALLRWDENRKTWNVVSNLPTLTYSCGLDLQRGSDGTLFLSWPEQDVAGSNITIYRENR
jgi:Bacterial Ig-like domain